MNSIAGRTRQIRFFLAGILAFLVLLAVSACGPVTVPAATPTPLPPEVPAGWICYQNETYGFEVCYPAASLLTTASDAHSRIELAYLLGTNLVEKWMDVDSREGLADCVSPQAEGYAAGSLAEETRTINGLEFFVQSGEDAGAGNHYAWTGYSTERDGVCVSLTGVLHSTNPSFYPTPPPEYDPAGEVAVFDDIAATFRWLEEATPEPVSTIPPGWICYQNALYAFEVCYPADATINEEAADHIRIDLAIAPGTNLSEKWMNVDGRTIPPDCESPQASGYDPGAIDSHTRTIAGLEFLVQAASEGAAGNIYQWTGYSTVRDSVCASLTGILHSTNPAMYSTPPAEFDKVAESEVFEQIASTFRWLDAATPTPPADDSPSATFTANTNCRRGASIDHEIVTFLREGQAAPIVGRNEDGSWWLIQVPGTAVRCWVWGKFVSSRGNLSGVPFVESPILGCWYRPPNEKKPRCYAPCPEGAKPGGVCEP
ncbi:MAG: SH3 domain-containing protein [Anaerolineales bacterium]